MFFFFGGIRERKPTNLRPTCMCVFSRDIYLSKYIYNDDKEKEQKMSINNRFVRYGKRKGGRSICLKINRRNRRANNEKMLTPYTRSGDAPHRMIVYLFFSFSFFFFLVLVYLVTIDRQECKYRLLSPLLFSLYALDRYKPSPLVSRTYQHHHHHHLCLYV